MGDFGGSDSEAREKARVTRGAAGNRLEGKRAEGMAMSEIRVECYAGYRADERPLRFTLRDHVFEVAEVEDRWYSPGATYFRVRATDGNFYILRREEGVDVWTLDAFRAARDTSDLMRIPDDVAMPGGPHSAS